MRVYTVSHFSTVNGMRNDGANWFLSKPEQSLSTQNVCVIYFRLKRKTYQMLFSNDA